MHELVVAVTGLSSASASSPSSSLAKLYARLVRQYTLTATATASNSASVETTRHQLHADNGDRLEQWPWNAWIQAVLRLGKVKSAIAERMAEDSSCRRRRRRRRLLVIVEGEEEEAAAEAWPVLVASARSAWESVDVGADNQEDEPRMMEVVVMRVVWDSPTDTGHVRSEDCHHATTHDRFSFIGFTVHASRNSTRVLVHNLWRWLHPTWCGIIVSARMNDRNTSHDKETDPLIYIDDPSYALIPVAKRLARENIASLAQNILDPLMFREENLTGEMSSTNLLPSMTYASSISVSSTSSSVSPYTVSSSHRAAIALDDPHRPWRPLESLRVACRTIGVHAFMVRIMDAEKATGDRGLVLKAVSECDSSTLSATGTSSVTLRMYVIDWPEPGRTAANANYDVRKSPTENQFRDFFTTAATAVTTNTHHHLPANWLDTARAHLASFRSNPAAIVKPTPSFAMSDMQVAQRARSLIEEMVEVLEPVAGVSGSLWRIVGEMRAMLAVGSSDGEMKASVKVYQPYLPAAQPVAALVYQIGGHNDGAGHAAATPSTPFCPSNSLQSLLNRHTSFAAAKSGFSTVHAPSSLALDTRLAGRRADFRSSQWQSPFDNESKTWESASSKSQQQRVKQQQERKRKRAGVGSGMAMVEF